MSAIDVEKTAQCKRCGSQRVAWVKSNRTGRFYLALALKSKGYAVYGPDSAHRVAGGITAYTHIPHKCDDPTRGGYKQCSDCGKHHRQLGTPDNCTNF